MHAKQRIMVLMVRRLAAAAVSKVRVWPSDISLGGSTKVPLTSVNEMIFSKIEGRRVKAPCHLQPVGDSSGALWCPFLLLDLTGLYHIFTLD